MKMFHALCLLLLAPSLVQAQTGSPYSDSSRDNSDVAAEVKALREALLQTQKQVALQQREIETLRERRRDQSRCPRQQCANDVARDLHPYSYRKFTHTSAQGQLYGRLFYQ